VDGHALLLYFIDDGFPHKLAPLACAGFVLERQAAFVFALARS
jgi:hypothetical protein